MPNITPATIVAFWRDAGFEKWYAKDEAFDNECRNRFLATHEEAAAGKLAAWEENAEGALALLILTDQFPRNMFRGSPRTFATDPLARAIADRAIARGFDRAIGMPMQTFFYLPFEHSELLADQELSLELFKALGDADGLKWAIDHYDIIKRFGRFPHRNVVLGRETTPDERAFLQSGGFAG
ncbi:hypothetical protein GJW-30_1_00155 [Variibacter gotjawalensis]|uniref:DUF924 domain-containing protein n=1 Tax=Variibacter gotjawalensis TaxID=1333996 RepID=A0A0S3PP58_9BRAD|nr:DUF924 family protein [Variibacter gotjawalensis]NIK47941.1 uncharacterized protein (DUF924 family) [Variibacter gotjawalensis]RZS49819.1 uncharacterized protein (DUF924 family) [Variibacter gotjawalensis]BAT57648.1 hypothetical protein GJW-30_1_00155 [Variibacter gotjawalensis]